MSFDFNDLLLKAPSIKAFGLRNKSGLVAFTGINVPTGVKIKVKNLEVRLEKSAP
jgi:hypothetical protein